MNLEQVLHDTDDQLPSVASGIGKSVLGGVQSTQKSLEERLPKKKVGQM